MRDDTDISESPLGSPCASLDESRNGNKNLQIEWTARNGALAPCPSRARALDVNFVIKKRVAQPRHLGRAAARSTPIFISTIIYRCKALDVSFPMALKPSYLDPCSSSYDHISDRRSGLTALGEFCELIFGCEFVIEPRRTGRSLQHESCRN
ncbi:hypothetical protein PIB30_017186 [Stylosanthes scabra]|uniref:Uncharacterized protein n=1 Tax=Stylosanthes scabra TaxID=79078 RepID=A0ABU6X932_9FABA|nr:hypothetical protein [Stylosanthes scabra]